MKPGISIRTESLIKAALYALLLVGIFHTSHRLMVSWWEGEDYNYCYLITPIVLYLIWEKREQLAGVEFRPSWAGLVPLAFGIFLFWLGELGGEYTTMYFASWFVLSGLLWLHMGWVKLKVIWFPIILLNAMFPPPEFINKTLTFKLKLISSQIGVWMMQAYGLSAYREGNVIDLGFTKLQVVDACSGLRYLFPLLIMAILLAYFYKSSLWKKVVLVVSAIPLTIITNSLRIAMTGVLYEIWGPQVAEDFFHGFSGWLIFMFGLAALLLEMWALNGFRTDTFRSFGSLGSSGASAIAAREEYNRKTLNENRNEIPLNEKSKNGVSLNRKPEVENQTAEEGHGSTITRLHGFTLKSLLSPPQFLVAVVMLAGTLALAQGVEFREKIPPAKSFALFPTQVGDWAGKRDVMEKEFIDGLKFSDYVIVDYRNPAGQTANFYTAYYESQRKGESIHSPETCLPGGGWEFKNAGTVTVPLISSPVSTNQRFNDSTITVNRAVMEKGAYKQLSYFWFPMRGRVLTSIWQMKWYTFWDALTRQRTDGALVRLITPVYQNEGIEDADKRLVAFTGAIVPVLNEFLPK